MSVSRLFSVTVNVLVPVTVKVALPSHIRPVPHTVDDVASYVNDAACSPAVASRKAKGSPSRFVIELPNVFPCKSFKLVFLRVAFLFRELL